MITLLSLWLPILLSAVLVFVATSVVHMVLAYHRTDFDKLPAEDEAMRALGEVGVAPGEYIMPYANSPSAMKNPAYVEKVKRGPVAVMSMFPPGMPC